MTYCAEQCDDWARLRSIISEAIMARAITGLLFLLLVSGCTVTKDVTVPRIDAGEPTGTVQLPGRYAALLQGGRWKRALSVRKAGQGTLLGPGLMGSGLTVARCAGYNFNFDVNDAFEGAAKTSLTSLFERVDFIEVALTPQQLRERGYDAQVIVRQGDLSADIKFIEFITQGAATVHVGIDLSDATGFIDRQDLEASGYSSTTSDLSCATGATIEAAAFQNALRDALHASASMIRNQLSKPRSQ